MYIILNYWLVFPLRFLLLLCCGFLFPLFLLFIFFLRLFFLTDLLRSLAFFLLLLLPFLPLDFLTLLDLFSFFILGFVQKGLIVKLSPSIGLLVGLACWKLLMLEILKIIPIPITLLYMGIYWYDFGISVKHFRNIFKENSASKVPELEEVFPFIG